MKTQTYQLSDILCFSSVPPANVRTVPYYDYNCVTSQQFPFCFILC